jgi:nucleoside-diphosphate-sugar epimerase
MSEIDKSKPVLVTGATGYLAAWIVKQLLEEGITVHATVRDLANKLKYEFLTRIAQSTPGKLVFFEADLLKGESFGKAMAGCELVIHTASPFEISKITNPQQQLIQPAVNDTRNVLTSVNHSETVKRVVITSSMAAIYGDAIDCRNAEGGILTERIWNTTSSLTHQPYAYSKTMAEKEAWKMADEQTTWDLVVINPGFILGPSLDKNNGGVSNGFMINLGNGKFTFGVPGGTMGISDVRDTAKAHILAGFNPKAKGRHIAAGENKSFLDIALILKKHYPELPLPKFAAPKWLSWLTGPIYGITRKHVSRNFNIDLKFDNSYIIKDLGMSFTPFEKTLCDHFEQLISDGLISTKK